MKLKITSITPATGAVAVAMTIAALPYIVAKLADANRRGQTDAVGAYARTLLCMVQKLPGVPS